MSASPFSFGTRLAAAGALVLGLFLGVGILLPGTWTAEASLEIAATPEELMPLLDGPEGWRRWTAWPDSGLVSHGPARGAGSGISWNHPELGRGAFEIVEVEARRGVRYRVEVEGGAMLTAGTVRLEPSSRGTRVTWHEEGDFGWNPLMGYWSLVMSGVQTDELLKGLGHLREIVEGDEGR